MAISLHSITSRFWPRIALRQPQKDPPDPPPPPPVALLRPDLHTLWRQPESELPQFIRDCAVAMRYRDLLGPLDWEHFPERPTHRPWPGPTPARRAPFVAAYLVKLEEHKTYMSALRQYLVEHPALIWLLGFDLVPAAGKAHGFDPQTSVPSRKQFGHVLRTLSPPMVDFLLDGTVHSLRMALPPECGFGDAVSFDTKHVIAWVKENNPKAYVHDRFDKSKQPPGDPDCRLGCKRKRNLSPEEHEQATEPGQPAAPAAPAASAPQTPASNPVPAKGLAIGEYYWGYGSGVVATKVPGWGEFVLAELTQPFNCADVSYFFPLLADVERRLGHKPRFGAGDAAFDAFYVYQYFHDAGGFVAVPLVLRGGQPVRQFSPQGLPLCAAGLPMPVKLTYTDRSHEVVHECARYACPRLFPQPTGQTCPASDPHFEHGGCTTTMATCAGARIRYQLDRDGADYQHVYQQRTADERVNSQACDLGIERPKLRNGRSIARLNTLTYVLINLRALQRVRQHQAERATQGGASGS